MTTEVWKCSHCGRLNNSSHTQCKRCHRLQDGTGTSQERETQQPTLPSWLPLLIGIILVPVLLVGAYIGCSLLMLFIVFSPTLHDLFSPSVTIPPTPQDFMVQIAVVFGLLFTAILLGIVYQITHRKSKV